MTAVQVQFTDKENPGGAFGGILLRQNKKGVAVICGTCGEVIPLEDDRIKIERIYEYEWVDISDEIIGE